MSSPFDPWTVFDQTVQEVHARNASVPAEQIESEIDQALAAVRAERFKENS
jgi:hypothetical protein